MTSDDHCVFCQGLCNCPLIDMLNHSTAFTIHCIMSTVLYCEHFLEFLWLVELTLITDKKPSCS